jgi:predicted dithiol-disulfide oxidoreductase (DUF899 family)
MLGEGMPDLIDRFLKYTEDRISVFCSNDQSEALHTYSCCPRGVGMLSGACHTLDLVPKGRDEDGLTFSMAWVRRHDQV